jgi:hypothetical protein
MLWALFAQPLLVPHCEWAKLAEIPHAHERGITVRPIYTFRSIRDIDDKYEYTYALFCKYCALVKIGGSDDVRKRRGRLESEHARDCITWLEEPGPEGRDHLQLIAAWRGNCQGYFHKRLARRKAYGEWFVYNDEVRQFLAHHGAEDLPPAPRWTREAARRLAAHVRIARAEERRLRVRGIGA